MNIALVHCVHGSEPFGLEVAKRVHSCFSFLSPIIGNPEALLKGVRFVDTDLNRCFPGNPKGNREERLAATLSRRLEVYDVVLDLHSTSAPCPLFGIITMPNSQKILLAKRLGLETLVIMPESIAGKGALIDCVQLGISLEVGAHRRVENVYDVLQALEYFSSGKIQENLRVLEAFAVIRDELQSSRSVAIKNFDEIKSGQLLAVDGTSEQRARRSFVAVLVDEDAYEGVLCLACREVSAMEWS